MAQQPTHHVSILTDEILQFFGQMQVTDRAIFLDGTLGGGGHTQALLDHFPQALVVACDQDTTALARAQIRFAQHSDRLVLQHVNFREIPLHLENIRANIQVRCSTPVGAPPFHGILLDLGLSSDQLDDPGRGFSFQVDGPLDMRMDVRQPKTAAQFLNSSTPADLSRIFQRGGMRFGVKELVQEIVHARPVTSTRQFAQLCEKVLARFQYKRKSKSHPATVPFQCLRIAVNDELGALEAFLSAAPNLLRERGRCCVISFHSLEDRLVTNTFRKWERSTTPRFLPVQGEQSKIGQLLTPHAVVPSELEQAQNPRARSARLRVFERGEEGMP